VKAWAVALMIAFAAYLDVTPDVVLDPAEASVSAVDAPSSPSKPNASDSTQGAIALVAQMTRISIGAQLPVTLPLRAAPGIGAGKSHERRIERPPNSSLLPV